MKKPSVPMMIVALFALALVGMVVAQAVNGKKPGILNEFAQCVTDSGAKYYGAFWCPHCQEQGQIFGKSKELLPYVECSTPDGQNQTQECIDAGITSYPTWILADGTELGGVQSPADLAEATGCTLPE